MPKRKAKRPRERWKDIPGFPLYQVSDMGRMRTFKGVNQYSPIRKTPRIMRTRIGHGGYKRVTLQNGDDQKQVVAVHLLVARAFMGPARGRVVRHKDGDRSNAKRSNLEYGSQSENSQDKLRHGTHSRGSQNAAALLEEHEVKWIRKTYGTKNKETGRKWTQQAIADELGISRQTVSDILLGVTWSYEGQSKRAPKRKKKR